jgi:hypothetical protein
MDNLALNGDSQAKPGQAKGRTTMEKVMEHAMENGRGHDPRVGRRKKPRLSSILTGYAGEQLVIAELGLRGYVATLTPRNLPDIDVQVSNADFTKCAGIQVKTHRGTRPNWVMTEKAEIDRPGNLFYVFVYLPEHGAPSFYVVPREAVAKFLREDHRTWLATPGRRGQQRRDNPVRRFKDPDGTYKDRWDLLGLGGQAATPAPPAPQRAPQVVDPGDRLAHQPPVVDARDPRRS